MSIATPQAESFPSHAPVLLYDGECGLCAASVQFMLRHERAAPAHAPRLHFAPLQGHFGARVRHARPSLATIDSVLWMPAASADPAAILMRSDAVIAALRYLGGPWSLLGVLGRLLPRALRDAAYDWIARRRRSLVPQVCLLPAAFDRSRFLD